MAMIKCSECGKDISDKAVACVNCGAPCSQTVQHTQKKKQIYKRPWFWIIIIVIGIVIIGALASNSDDTSDVPHPSPFVEDVVEPTPPLDDTTSDEDDLSNLQKALNFTIGIVDGLYERPSSIFNDDSGEYAGLSGTLTAYRINAFLSDEATQTYRTFYYALYWRDAYIDEFGEDEYIDEAERQIAEIISVSEMQRITESMAQMEVIREEAAALDEQGFKDSAQTISYDNLIRRPNDYDGEIIKITVRITQIFDRGGVLGGLYEKGFAGTQGGNEWIIIYELPEGASRIIEGDTITFYGVYNGVRERQRAIDGVRVHIPHMTASYHS